VTDDRTFAVLDIDGVLADVRHRLHHLERRPKDWDSFFADAPNDPLLQQGLDTAIELTGDHEVIYLTGRPERCRADTEQWLNRFRFPAGRLIMRRNTDRRPARLTKVQELNRLGRQGRVVVLVDDDERVVESARSAGYSVIHATWMPEHPDQQQSLFQAQETEGRT
jgi:hypothetical protein